MSGRPWFKFFPADWRSDTKLRACSAQARGVWLELILLMEASEPPGYVVVNGAPLTMAQIARQTGLKATELRSGITELDAAGVLSRDETGAIFSRKMVRNRIQSDLQRERVSKRWERENPEKSTEVEKSGNTGSHTHILEARYQKEEVRDTPSESLLSTKPVDLGQEDMLAAMFGDAGLPAEVAPKATSKAKPHKGLNGHAADFDRWYAAYPRKKSRGAAEKAFLTAIKLATVDQLVEGARGYAAHIASKPPDEQRFVQHPATWLNAKGWLDEHPIPALITGGHDGRPQDFSPADQRRADNYGRAFSPATVAAVRRLTGRGSGD